MEPMKVIHNIYIATAADITTLDDEIDIYTDSLSRAITTICHSHNLLQKVIISDHIL